jgi:hypothetical protein
VRTAWELELEPGAAATGGAGFLVTLSWRKGQLLSGGSFFESNDIMAQSWS